MNEPAAPRVSVILPVNRDDGFLDEAIHSVLNQTLRQLELIIVANNCEDQLWRRLQTIEDPRVCLLRTRLGQLPFNLNLAIEHAAAPYVARMDADDVCEPHRLATQLAFLEQHQDIAAVGTMYRYIDAAGRHIGLPKPVHLTPESIARHLPYESCLPHPTVIMRKSAVVSVGGYAYGLYAEDWDLWLRLSRAEHRLANLPEVLLLYRIHGGQSTSLKSVRRNMGNVLGLLVRELVMTGRPAFVFGATAYLFWELLRWCWHKVRGT